MSSTAGMTFAEVAAIESALARKRDGTIHQRQYSAEVNPSLAYKHALAALQQEGSLFTTRGEAARRGFSRSGWANACRILVEKGIAERAPRLPNGRPAGEIRLVNR
jgi:hypothetical protein